MGREDDELTCAEAPSWMSLREARAVLRAHRGCGCALHAVAAALLEGGHRACWPATESLETAEQWVAAYAARNLTTSIDNGRVGLVTDETVTGVLLPHDIAARVYDRLGCPAATLAPPPRDLCTTDWIVLVRPEPIAAQALSVLERVGVRFLAPGHRLDLPTTTGPDETGQWWWTQWPQPSRIADMAHAVATPHLRTLLNLCLDAAGSGVEVVRGRRGGPIQLRPAGTTVTVDAAAAAEIDQHAAARPRSEAASALIVLGARVRAIAGSADSVLIRDATGFDTVATLTDSPTPSDGGTTR